MVALYVGGQKVAWSDAERVFANVANETRRIELRNDAGTVLARIVPETPTREDDPDWVKAITPEDTARRLAGPFMTLEEYRKQEGPQ
jgi:hypothetical protein